MESLCFFLCCVSVFWVFFFAWLFKICCLFVFFVFCSWDLLDVDDVTVISNCFFFLGGYK